MHMNVIFADHPLEDLDIFSITDLDEEVLASHFYVPFKHVVVILCDPDQMGCQSRHAVAIVARNSL